MNKPWHPTIHSEVEAGTLRGKLPIGVVNVRSVPPKMTATLKRRALKKKADSRHLPHGR